MHSTVEQPPLGGGVDFRKFFRKSTVAHRKNKFVQIYRIAHNLARLVRACVALGRSATGVTDRPMTSLTLTLFSLPPYLYCALALYVQLYNKDVLSLPDRRPSFRNAGPGLDHIVPLSATVSRLVELLLLY